MSVERKIDLLLQEAENWSKTVTEHEKWHAPEGTFEKGPEAIAKTVSQNWTAGYKTTMARLNFFLNRGGKNVSPSVRANVNKAKEIVRKHYNKEK